ncbi:hypothetical protein N9L19_01510 [bacterium]|nr:hypothetical protein [bacterium]
MRQGVGGFAEFRVIAKSHMYRARKLEVQNSDEDIACAVGLTVGDDATMPAVQTAFTEAEANIFTEDDVTTQMANDRNQSLYLMHFAIKRLIDAHVSVYVSHELFVLNHQDLCVIANKLALPDTSIQIAPTFGVCCFYRS